MFIKRLKPNVYDVFNGNGWDNWTRVLRTRDGVKVITGKPLNRSALTIVTERLYRK